MLIECNQLLQALFDLAAHPEYIQPLRDEVATVVTEEGGEDQLLATGLAKLHRMDSIFKESQRFHHANLRVFAPTASAITISRC